MFVSTVFAKQIKLSNTYAINKVVFTRDNLKPLTKVRFKQISRIRLFVDCVQKCLQSRKNHFQLLFFFCLCVWIPVDSIVKNEKLQKVCSGAKICVFSMRRIDQILGSLVNFKNAKEIFLRYFNVFDDKKIKKLIDFFNFFLN